ncbi:unnamed protein product [Meloidogyne enterolobii]|uniref:Uncharacterized protein n=1 Tax=Meloidogyne enterolobii TaxID=390850 RepID=A0ACB0Y2G7_MELEN
MIQTGELTFKSDFDFKFKDAFEFIKKDMGEKSVELLKPENADNGDKQEIANIIFALLFILYKNQKAKFDYLCGKLDERNSAEILQLLKRLDNYDRLSPIPFTSILNNSSNNLFSSNNSNFQIFSSQNQKDKLEEISKYKIKSAELEAKYNQIESINFKLNEQLGNAQNEFIDLENKYENLKQADNEKQGSLELLNIQLREITDELETCRYNNSQLQRELKSLNERHSRAFQKSANDLKSKEDEVKLLYIRLDALVKQITEKDSSENKLKFMEQQIANQQGTIGELRSGLEQALDRANFAETELIKYKRIHNNNINIQNNTNSNTDNSISLHDDLNSCKITENHSNLNDSFDNQIASQSDEFAKLKTRLELIQYEKRELENENKEFCLKFKEFSNSQSKNILEKAKEIERFKQECESNQNELKRMQQKEINLIEKNKLIEEENSQLKTSIKKLEDSIDKAAQVISEYSNSYLDQQQQFSAVDYLQLKHEINKLQTENERLLSKMDQLRHEATQEQRLITQHWYQSQLDLLKARHYFGASSSISSSMRSSLIDNNNCSNRCSTPNNQQQQQLPSEEIKNSSLSNTQKSFFRRTDLNNTTNFNSFPPHR